MKRGANRIWLSACLGAALFISACRVEYTPQLPNTESAGVTDFTFPEDAEPTIANLDYVKTQLLVQPYPGAEGDQVSAAIAASGATIAGGMAEVDLTVLTVREDALAQTAAALADSGLFETIHKNYLYSANLTPNDPSYLRQAYFTGMNLDDAWNLTTGNEQVLIAVVDTGVDAMHPDFGGKVLGGWSSDGAGTFEDVHGHGTAVAGVAAAVGNNGLGMAGVSWNSPIIAARVADRFGQSSSSDIAAGILWAAGNGAKVINVSFAPLWTDRVVRSAAQSAFARGSLVVISAGNGAGLSTVEGYTETVIVGAVNNDVLAPFSDRGPFVDLVAPGVSIRAPQRGGGYGVVSGTSFAAPIVSGVAALMWSVHPEMRPAVLRQLLLDSAVDLGPAGRDVSFGEGRVDALAAVQAAIANRDAIDVTPPALTLVRPRSGDTVQGKYIIMAEATDFSGLAEVVLSIDGLPYASDTRWPYFFIVDSNSFDAGAHELSIHALDQAGNQSQPIVLSVPFARWSEQNSATGSIRFRTPVDGATVTGNVLIQASVSDPDGLSVMEWLINNESFLVSRVSGTSSGVSYLWRADQSTPGEHRITIRLTDATGQSASASLSLTRR